MSPLPPRRRPAKPIGSRAKKFGPKSDPKAEVKPPLKQDSEGSEVSEVSEDPKPPAKKSGKKSSS